MNDSLIRKIQSNNNTHKNRLFELSFVMKFKKKNNIKKVLKLINTKLTFKR